MLFSVKNVRIYRYEVSESKSIDREWNKLIFVKNEKGGSSGHG